MGEPEINPAFADPNNFEGDRPPDWDARQQRVVRRDDYTCLNCNTHNPERICTLPEWPIERGGTWSLDNILTLCEDCANKFYQEDSGRQESQEPPQHSESASENEQRQQVADQSETQNDDSLSGLIRVFVGVVLGTFLGGVYLIALSLATLLSNGLVFQVVFYGFPLGGLVAGRQYRLTTAIALWSPALVYLTVGLFNLELFPIASPFFWIPVVLPVIGIVYGLLADHFDFTLRDQIRQSQILD